MNTMRTKEICEIISCSSESRHYNFFGSYNIFKMNNSGQLLLFLLLLYLILHVKRYKTWKNGSKSMGTGCENLNDYGRYRDAAGTSVQIDHIKENITLHSPRSGPFPLTFMHAFKKRMEIYDENSFSIINPNLNNAVGVVQYSFHNERGTVYGNSTQFTVMCRCISHDCSNAIKLIPTNCSNTIKFFYERTKEEGKYTECHTGIMKFERGNDNKEEYFRSVDYTTSYMPKIDYAVSMGRHHWHATGIRGAVQEQLCSEVKNDMINFNDICKDFNEFNERMHNGNTGLIDDYCPLNNSFFYFPHEHANVKTELVEDENDGKGLQKTFERALSASKWIGTQQDEYAIGSYVNTYFNEKEEYPSFEEIIAIYLVGLLGFYDLLDKHSNEPMCFETIFSSKCFLALLSIFIAAVDFIVSLLRVIRAKYWWSSFFAFADATFVPLDGEYETSKGGIYVGTFIVGHLKTYDGYLDTLSIVQIFFFITVIISLSLLTYNLGINRSQNKSRYHGLFCVYT